MVKLGEYSEELENDYAQAAMKVLKERKRDEKTTYLELLDRILCNHSKYFPDSFKEFEPDHRVREFFCLKYKDIMEILKKLDDEDQAGVKAVLNELGGDVKAFVNCYKSIIGSQKNKQKLAVRMTRYQNLRVCPYCNHNWITSRGKSVGVEMDHFVPKNDYPIFALCMYNLVPCCSLCNKIKSKKSFREEIISPYDQTHNLSQEIKFSYNSFEEKVEIFGPEKHIKNLKLMQGYELNDLEARELQQKIKMYCKTQVEEIRHLLKEVDHQGVTDTEIYRSIFGNLFDEDSIAKYPLCKMKADLFKQWAGFTF